MKSHLLASFRERFKQLPAQAQEEARQAYQQFKADPSHPGLRFKTMTVKGGKILASVRIGLHYRALGLMRQGDVYWFWIGTHAEYDHLVN